MAPSRPTPPPRRPPSPERAAFTLLELVVAVAIMAILAGAVAPVASKLLESRGERATREELQVLAAAAAEYFRDVGSLPDGPADLALDPGAPGWAGPYVADLSSDPRSGSVVTAVDAWSRPYRFTAQGPSSLLLESAGADGAFDAGEDVENLLDVTSIRREETLVALRTVRQAITLYNGAYLPDDPLPASYGQILTRLVARGLLPAEEPYAVDGWGDPFEPDPPGATPVTDVRSTHVP